LIVAESENNYMMLKAHSFATPDTPSTPEQNL